MTTWTAIPDTSLDPGKPARSIDAKALRDNPIAIAEGATGAPKVRTAALQPPSAGDIRLLSLIRTSIASTLTAYPSSGYDLEQSNPSHRAFTVMVAGTIRCKVSHYRGPVAETSYVRVLKNDVLVQEWSTTSATPVERVVDVAVAVGDIIAFQHRSVSGNTVYMGVIGAYSGTSDFAVA